MEAAAARPEPRAGRSGRQVHINETLHLGFRFHGERGILFLEREPGRGQS